MFFSDGMCASSIIVVFMGGIVAVTKKLSSDSCMTNMSVGRKYMVVDEMIQEIDSGYSNSSS